MEQIKSRPAKRKSAALDIALPSSALLASLGTSIANIALPTLAEAFAAPFAHVQAVVVAYLGTMTLAVVFAGRLGDRFGLRRILIAGLAIFAAASMLCVLAGDLWALSAARALQGIGGAFMMTTSMALMRQTAVKQQVGRAMGLLGTVSAIGTALGPSLGGLLIASLGWRAIFWVQALLASTTLALAFAALPKDGPPAVGAARTWLSLGRRFALRLVVNSLVAAVMMATLVVGPFYLSFGLGLGAAQVGFVMAAGPVISIVSGVPCGRLVDAWGHRRMIIAGLGLVTTGAALLALLPDFAGLVGYLAALLVLTPGYQLFQAANNTAALVGISQRQRGVVAGWLAFSRNLGLIAGAWLMGSIFASVVSSLELANAVAASIDEGMRLTFVVAACFSGLALGIAIRAERLSSSAL